MRKIIATDYDGTLNQGGIQPHVAEAIAAFRAAGNLFGVVTGRDRQGSLDIFREEKKFAFDFILALNGALAYDCEGNKLYEVSVDGSQAYGDTTLARALAARIWELTGYHCGVAFDGWRMDLHPDYPEGGRIKWNTMTPYAEKFGSLDGAFEQMKTFLQMNTICESEARAGEVTAILQSEFGAYVNPLQNGICIDIPARGMDKGEAVARYASVVGVSEAHIWTAGDNFNDIAMLQRFRGCAMSGGVDAAKQVSAHVCRDIAEVVALAMSAAE